MTTIQKLFVLSLCAFLVLCSSNSYAQTATTNFERKHLSTVSHEPLSTTDPTGAGTTDPTGAGTTDPTGADTTDPTGAGTANPAGTPHPTHPTPSPDPTHPANTPRADTDVHPITVLLPLHTLTDGMNVIAETREGGLLAVVMEKGRLVDMGTIDPDGTFYKFEQENKCKDFFANPCRDGSKPSVYFDPYLRKCIGVCDVIDLDPVAYNPINPYSLRPNGPCSDYIVQPCRKGEYLVMYYDPYKKVCVAYCEY